MQYYKEITLKDGTACVLRNPTADDAQAILQHMIQTSGETENMARYPDEICMTAEQEAAYLAQLAKSENAIMICASVDGRIVANAGINPVSAYEKLRHRAEFGISIQRAYWGRGIGSAVLTAVLQAAKQAGYHQVELEVVADNARAIALYEKLGFVRYGTREHAFYCRDGHYVAEHLMLCRV